MKVILVNGSPHKEGCTYTALNYISQILSSEGIDSEIFWIGNKALSGCLGCGYCFKNQKCCFNDTVNQFSEKAKEADGFIFGSPVHFASMTGAMTSFMDRAFFSDGAGNNYLLRKPAAVITSLRRTGGSATLDQMQKWLAYNQMPIISSRYWNVIHGQTPEEVMQDTEGLQIMRVLAKNMAWILKCIEAGKKEGISAPEIEEKTFMNFIH
ncbi:MAG: flavodoxin family protein [Bacteroidales bacterium]|nr:flavodoxin family protein [Bacteroidales bacterium]